MALEVADFIPTKKYTFERLRALMEDNGIWPGVVGAATAMQVQQREAGTNMSVDVLLGGAWVQGTTKSRQGLYHVYNPSRINVATIGNNASGKPRVDQIILAINDSSVVGVSDTAEFRIIEGVASTGAQLTNPLESSTYRLGAKTDAEIKATFPNFIHLADVIVASGDAAITNAKISERRSLALGSMRSKSFVLASQSRTGVTTLGLLTTPDEASVLVPDGGFLEITAHLLMAQSGTGGGTCAVLINGEPVTLRQTGNTSSNLEIQMVGANNLSQVATDPRAGLVAEVNTGTADTDVNAASVNSPQGQMVFAPAGAGSVSKGSQGPGGGAVRVFFDRAVMAKVELQFATSVGASSVVAEKRRLWVEAKGFPN